MKAESQPGVTNLAAETPIQPFAVQAVSPAQNVIHTENGDRIRGVECCRCGLKFLPGRVICPGCAESELRGCLLRTYGKLYSFTTVHVSSTRTTPYTIGYVDLDEGVRLLATIAGNPRAISPDISVRLTGDTGRWTFEPVADKEAS